MLREALKISSPLDLVSREVPRFHRDHSGTLHRVHDLTILIKIIELSGEDIGS